MGALSRIVQGPLRSSTSAEGAPPRGPLAPAFEVRRPALREAPLKEPALPDAEEVVRGAPLDLVEAQAGVAAMESPTPQEPAEPRLTEGDGARRAQDPRPTMPASARRREEREPLRNLPHQPAVKPEHVAPEATAEHASGRAPERAPSRPETQAPPARVARLEAIGPQATPLPKRGRAEVERRPGMIVSSAPPLVVRERLIEHTIERSLRTLVVERSRGAPESDEAPPAQRSEARSRARDAEPQPGAPPSQKLPTPASPPTPAPPLTPAPLARRPEASPSPPAVVAPLMPQEARSPRPEKLDRQAAAPHDTTLMRPAPAQRPGPLPVAPRAPRAPSSPVIKLVPRDTLAQRPGAAAPSAPRPAGPAITVSIGRLEVHTRAREAPPQPGVTMPRAHEIDPGLSFGPLSPGRW